MGSQFYQLPQQSCGGAFSAGGCHPIFSSWTRSSHEEPAGFVKPKHLGNTQTTGVENICFEDGPNTSSRPYSLLQNTPSCVHALKQPPDVPKSCCERPKLC